MKLNLASLIAGILIGAAAVGLVSSKASSQAYIPPGAKGPVLPAPPSMQLVIGRAGEMFVLDQQTGELFQLSEIQGELKPVKLATVPPGDARAAMPGAIPAWQVLGVEPPLILQPRPKYR